MWDSPVDVEGIPHGIAVSAFPNNQLLAGLLEKTVDIFLGLNRRATEEYYRSSQIYKVRYGFLLRSR